MAWRFGPTHACQGVWAAATVMFTVMLVSRVMGGDRVGGRWVRYIQGVDPADRYFTAFDVTGERTSAIGGVSLRGCNALMS